MKIECAILSIGSELLEGSVVDTNSAFLGNELSLMGIKPKSIRMVADDEAEIVGAFLELSKKYDLIFTTGGLGPTFDDITALCVAKSAGVELEFNEEAYRKMKSILDKAGVEIHETHKKQAYLPKNCLIFNNFSGTAEGFGVKVNKSLIISMPGVPSEMKLMFEGSIKPYLFNNFKLSKIIKKTLTFAMISESDIDKVIREIEIPSEIECIINVGKGLVLVKLRGQNESKINEIATQLIDKFNKNFIGFDEDTPAQSLINILKEKKLTLSTAESCTGGLIAKLFTDISGASEVYLGSVVSYANDVKSNILNVKKETLERFGAVSEEVARQMAEGALDVLKSDIAIATTGIAGPAGATQNKPVGTVYVAIASRNKTVTKLLSLRGTRDDIRMRASNNAIFMTINAIKSGELL